MRFVAASLASLFGVMPAAAEQLSALTQPTDTKAACVFATDPNRHDKPIDEAMLVSTLGQNVTHPMDIVRLTPDNKAIDHNERIVPDGMERTLTLEPPLPTNGRYYVMTVMLDEPLKQFIPKVNGFDRQEVLSWWDDGHITKLDLVQSIRHEDDRAPQYWRIHVPPKASAYGPLWPIQRQTFAVVACPREPEKDPIVYMVSRDVSNKTWAFVDTLLAVFVIWAGAAAALNQSSRDHPVPAAQSAPRHWLGRSLRAMNPIVMTQDAMGFGSLSRLQVFYFTLIVVATLTFVFIRAGFLSEISENLLWLLGITGVGTAATKLVAKERAAHEDEITFTTHRWLRRHGVVFPPRVPRWHDLLITGQEFNIFNFQSLVFSGLVGFWILSSAMQNLADLVIPPHLMILLGLSQALYVGGKALGAGGEQRQKLNNAVTHAIASETKLLDPLPIGSAFRTEARERGFRYGLGEKVPTPLAEVPKESMDAFLTFQRDASAVVSLANEVLGGRERLQVWPADPPDDTFSAPSSDSSPTVDPASVPGAILTVTSEAALANAAQAEKGAAQAPAE